MHIVVHLQIDTRYIFEPRTIFRMELLVLDALDWRLRSITPFTFMYLFAFKVDPNGKHIRELIHQATQVTLATIHGIPRKIVYPTLYVCTPSVPKKTNLVIDWFFRDGGSTK